MEQEVTKLKREAETIKATFERQNLSWEESMNLLKDAVSLKDMVVRLRAKLFKLNEHQFSGGTCHG